MMKELSLGYAESIRAGVMRIMNFRGTVTGLDRFLASLPYLLPLFSVLPLFLLGAMLLPGADILSPVLSAVVGISVMSGALFGQYGSLIVFFGLYLLVVRNSEVKYFIRFHTMQSLLFGIAASLVGLVLSLLGPALGPLETWLGLLVSLAVGGASIYSIFCSIMGNYGSIPVISEAVESQLRF